MATRSTSVPDPLRRSQPLTAMPFFSVHLSALPRVLRRFICTRQGLVLSVALLLAGAVTQTPAQAPSTIPFPKDRNAMSWKTECVGRVLIDMPTDRPRSWSNEFDDAEVRRLQRPLNLSQFWSGVETVRDQYAKQSHRTGSSRLGHYERVDARKAAFVMGYRSDASFFGPFMWRFLHLDDQHAYEFKQSLSTGNTPPSPELFKPYIERYSPVLSRLTPLRDGEIPSGEGLCIDGALVSGDTGKNAKAGLSIEIAKGSYLGLGYLENNHEAAMYSGFETLKFDEDRARVGLTFQNEPEGYKEFKVLRRRERTLAGLLGQEFITRTTLNNGRTFYRFKFLIKGGQGLLEPTLSIHMGTPDTAKSADGVVYATLPPESELMALWDSVLATLRLRPGALPAGQVLRAVN